MTVLVALVALCVVNMVLIWQMATLIGRVDEVQDYMRTAVRWLARMEAYRVRVAGRQNGEEEES